MTAPVPQQPSVGDFMASARPIALRGNTPWASAKAEEVTEILRRAARRAPRSQQVHLGPSEIGVACDRQVVGKLLGLAVTNHVADPWPSIVGTAVHAWLADAFELDNTSIGRRRWFTERRVTPHAEHPGTADLYDAQDRALLDHKVLGESSLAKVRAVGGPPRKYKAQLFLYGLGYLREGYPVDRVGLIAYPRTGSSLDGIYVWEAPMDQAAADLVREVFRDMERRRAWAQEISFGSWRIEDVPITPSQDECYHCPFYRPDAEHSGAGCSGKLPHLS